MESSQSDLYFKRCFRNKNNVTLFSSNVTGGGNDEQLKLIENYYLEKIGKKVFD